MPILRAIPLATSARLVGLPSPANGTAFHGDEEAPYRVDPEGSVTESNRRSVEIKREPGDGYWSEVWNKKPFHLSYWSGRSTQDQMYSTGYVTRADWNDRRFKNPKFDKMVLDARGELDEAKRKKMYRDIAVVMRDQGGLIVPFFNQFIDAVDSRVGGYRKNPAAELMDGYALAECWLAA